MTRYLIVNRFDFEHRDLGHWLMNFKTAPAALSYYKERFEILDQHVLVEARVFDPCSSPMIGMEDGARGSFWRNNQCHHTCQFNADCKVECRMVGDTMVFNRTLERK